jgi:hypothetical protein
MDLVILCVQQGLMKTGKRMSGGETVMTFLSIFNALSQYRENPVRD